MRGSEDAGRPGASQADGRFADPPAASSPTALALRDALLQASGDSVKALVMYGSQLVKADARSASAWDLVVIVDDYRAFHKALRRTGHYRRPAWLLNLLSRTLPPNVTAFDTGDPELPLAKCVVVSAEHFHRALAPRSPDHFLKGRMVQQVAVLWAASDDDERWVRELLAGARNDVLAWAGPTVPEPFTPEQLAHHMLSVSYAGEVRPEGDERVRQVFEAQRDFLSWAYTRVLERAAEMGRVEEVEPGRYRLVPPPTAADRRRVERYFERSKVRSTMRWGKHIVTFNDWLTYIQKKVERRTGMEIEVTAWERRLPLLLLWPKVFHVVRNRPRLEGANGASGGGADRRDPPGGGAAEVSSQPETER